MCLCKRIRSSGKRIRSSGPLQPGRWREMTEKLPDCVSMVAHLAATADSSLNTLDGGVHQACWADLSCRATSSPSIVPARNLRSSFSSPVCTGHVLKSATPPESRSRFCWGTWRRLPFRHQDGSNRPDRPARPGCRRVRPGSALRYLPAPWRAARTGP